MIDEDRVEGRRLGLASGFADGPPGGGRAEIWRRLWFTLGALIVYRLGSYLPIPGLDPQGVSAFFSTPETGLLGLLDVLAGGGALYRLSIFALGIMPYISAFIIVELASHIVPRLRSLATDGTAGRRRLNQYARILTLALAALQAFGIAMALKSVPGLVVVPGFLFEATTILALAAGAIFVMWLAEQITVRGLGNGALVILMCGIVSHLPFALFGALESIKTGDLDARWLLFTPLMTAALMALVVVVERAVRRITIYDPSGEIGVRADDSRYAHITLKLNPTGVWVPIAASVLATPLAGIIANVGGQGTLWYRDFRVGRSGYLLLDALLIVLFAVLSGLAIFDPTRTARRLKDAGGFVPGFRPGENTARHLRATQIVLAVIGAVYLLVVCVLPELIYRRYYLPLAFGGLPTFLLAWFMVHILVQMRQYVRP